MPIHDQSYRRYEARAPLSPWRAWPIAREALRAVLHRRVLVPLALLAWAPLVVRAVQIVLVTRVPEMGRVLPVDVRLFGEFQGLQLHLAVFLSILTGAGLVADDLRTGGVLLVLSRAIAPRDYVAGKLAALTLVNLGVTLAPALALYAAAVGLAPTQFLRLDLVWLPFAILLDGLVLALTVSLLTIAASSLTERAWAAGLGLLAGLLGLDLVQVTLLGGFGLRLAALLSPLGALRLFGGALFGAAGLTPCHGLLALVAVLALGAAAVLVLRSRIRAVEIVT